MYANCIHGTGSTTESKAKRTAKVQCVSGLGFLTLEIVISAFSILSNNLQERKIKGEIVDNMENEIMSPQVLHYLKSQLL